MRPWRQKDEPRRVAARSQFPDFEAQQHLHTRLSIVRPHRHMQVSRVGVPHGGDASFANIVVATPRQNGVPRDAHPCLENPNRTRRPLHALAPQRICRTRRIRCLKPRKGPPIRTDAAKVSGESNPYNAQPHIENKGSEKRLGWNIPWGKGKIIEVMVLWFVAFVVSRSSIWKMGMWVLGIASETELSPSGQAAFTLFLDFTMLWATVGIIGKTLKKFKPFRNKDIFPFSKKGKWWITVLISCCCIPIVDWLGTHMTVWFPEDVELPTNNVVVQLSRGDLIPNVLYFILLSLCAPVWEELMFRGFLLQSLGKFLPASVAVLVSSAIFAFMHGNLRQFVPLCVLGVIIGNAFVQTRNLIPAIVLHSLYNCYVFAHVLLGV